MPHLIIIIYRTIIIYFMVLIILRLMGKREIGELSPFDFVVAVIIAELAAIPMEDPDIPLYHGIVPLITLGVLEIGLSYIMLKSKTLRNIAYGRPQIVIEKGKILHKEMKKARYNLDDLFGQLREAGYPNINDVEYGILETSGNLTVIPKSNKRPLSPEDLGLSVSYEGLPINLILDGDIISPNLKMAGKTEQWLKEQLDEKEKGLKAEQVLVASLDSQGVLFVNKK